MTILNPVYLPLLACRPKHKPALLSSRFATKHAESWRIYFHKQSICIYHDKSLKTKWITEYPLSLFSTSFASKIRFKRKIFSMSQWYFEKSAQNLVTSRSRECREFTTSGFRECRKHQYSSNIYLGILLKHLPVGRTLNENWTGTTNLSALCSTIMRWL